MTFLFTFLVALGFLFLFRMDFDDAFIVAAVGILCCALLKKRRRKTRLETTRKISKKRSKLGFYKTYFLPMKSKDEAQFFKYKRLTLAFFNKLLHLVTPELLKRNFPDAINAEQRLAITLH